MRACLICCLLLFCGMIQAAALSLIFSNDTHGSYLPVPVKTEAGMDSVGGYFNLYRLLPKTNVNRPGGQAQNTLWLDAGDQQTGSAFSSYQYNGALGGAVVEVFNQLGLDAATFGNHEFDQSLANTLKLTKLARYPFLSANLVWKKNGKPITKKPYAVFKRGKLKVGVIGLTLTELPEKVKADNVQDINILPYKTAIDKYLPEVDRKTDLIILLTHNGWEADSLLATQLDSRVDVIVGGHSHHAFSQPQKVNGILILQTGAFLNYLGYLTLQVEKDKVTGFFPKTCLLPVSANYLAKLEKDRSAVYSSYMDSNPNGVHYITPHPVNPVRFRTFVQHISGLIDQEMDTVVGSIPADWLPDKFHETEASRWQANALYRHYRESVKPDLAMLNCGGLRKRIAKGAVTRRDLLEMLPFTNYITFFSCYGRDLMTFWELNKQTMDTKVHDIVQANKLHEVIWDVAPGYPIPPPLYLDDQPVIADKVYRVVSHDFLVGQADKYLGFKPFDIVTTNDLIFDVMLEELHKQY